MIKNNKGYALVTVLLTITIFMILGLSFMNQALITTKQVASVETKVKSTDLAEMGAEYYKHWILNEISNRAKKCVNDELNAEECKDIKTEKDIIDAKEYIYKELSGISETAFIKEIDNSIAFKINNINFEDDSIVTYESSGLVDGNEGRKILSEIKLDLGNVIVGEKLEGETGVDEIISFVNNYPSDSEFTSCDKYVYKVDFTNNDECLFNGDKEFKNNNKPSFNDTIMKVKGDLTIPNINNSELNHSIFYVTGDFINNNNLNGTHNYTVYVGGKATIGNLNNATGVTFCVNELDSFQGTNSKLDEVKIFALKGTSSSHVNVGVEAFTSPKGACYLESSLGEYDNINWNVPNVINEVYDYN